MKTTRSERTRSPFSILGQSRTRTVAHLSTGQRAIARAWGRWSSWGLGLCLALSVSTAWATVSVKPRVTVNVQGATVKVSLNDGKGGIVSKLTGNAPLEAAETIRVRDTESLVVEVEAPDHATLSKTFDHDWCKANEGKSDALPIDITLVRIRESFDVRFENAPGGATVTVSDASGSNRTVREEGTLVFKRADANSAWESASVRVEAPGFEARTVAVSREAMASASVNAGRRLLDLRLDALRDTKRLRLLCNVPGAEVTLPGVEGVPARATPARTNDALELEYTFFRATAGSAWSKLRLRVAAEGHEWHSSDGEPSEVFERDFDKGEVEKLNGLISLMQFAKLQFVRTPLLHYLVDSREARLVETNVMASVSDTEVGGQPQLLIEPSQGRTERFLISRLSVPQAPWSPAADGKSGDAAERGRKLFFAMANYGFATDGTPKLIGSSVYYWQQGTRLPAELTQRPQDFAMDPCVTPDGLYVYYSGLINNVRGICRVSTGGGIPFTVTEGERYIDTEPTVADKYRLAFTRRTLNAPPDKPPTVYLQAEENGVPKDGLFGPVAAGHSPSLSSAGTRLALVDPQGRLCVADANRAWRVQAVSDGAMHAFPTWVGDRTIYFAAQKHQSERGLPHYDLFRLQLEADGSVGQPQRLTSNASMDSAPAVSEDGKDLYFLSNRGASRHGDPWFQIYLMRLPSGQ